MAYNENIPLATDRIKDSQADILANFSAIKTLVDINHGTFGAADEGKHPFVTLPVQSVSPPAGAFAATDTGFYSYVDTITTKQEIHTNVIHASGVSQIPSTASILGIVGAPTNDMSGWTYLPSGILLRWGNATGSSTVTTTYTTGIGSAPAFKKVFNVVLTPYWGTTSDADFAVRLIDFSETQFRWYVSKRTTTGAETTPRHIRYISIGY